MRRIAQALDAFLNRLSRILIAMGIIVLMLLTFIMVAGVILRYFFNMPIPGVLEVIEYMMVTLLTLGLAYTAVARRNIIIDILITHLPARVHTGFIGVASIVSLGFFVIVTWASVLYAQSQYAVMAVSSILHIPRWPFASVVAFGCFLLTLVLIGDVIKNFFHARGSDSK
jgi:TRAP-type C4-dicarboxylate transport system permease small subunit